MTVHFTARAFRDMAELPRADQQRLTADLDRLAAVATTGHLANDARAVGVQVMALRGQPGSFRVRRGDYRVILTVTGQDEVTVEAVGHRREIYD